MPTPARGLTDWIELTFVSGEPLFVQPSAIAAIRPAAHPDQGCSVVYPFGFADVGWIVKESPRTIIMSLHNARVIRP